MVACLFSLLNKSKSKNEENKEPIAAPLRLKYIIRIVLINIFIIIAIRKHIIIDL